MLLLKCCSQYASTHNASKFGKIRMATGLERRVFTPTPKKGNTKECSNYFTTALISCQKDYAQNPSSQVLTVREWRTYRCTSQIQERQRNEKPNCQYRLNHKKTKGIPKNIYSASLTILKPLTVWITTKSGIFLNRQEYQTTLPAT